MSLQARVESDFVQAYKAKDQLKVAVLRMLKTAVKNRQVELAKPLEPLSDEAVLDLILKQAKQRQESIEQYRNAGRADLLDQEAAELAVLETYLPTPFTPEELAAVVEQTIAAQGAAGMKDMGRVMQAISTAHKGRFDAKELSSLVKVKLGA